jgi:hypothetical protein
MIIAKQRLGKIIPEATLSAVKGHPLLGNKYNNTQKG